MMIPIAMPKIKVLHQEDLNRKKEKSDLNFLIIIPVTMEVQRQTLRRVTDQKNEFKL